MTAPRVAALVPVKSLVAAKSRLANELPPAQRGAVTLAMLRAVLEQLTLTPGIDAVATISRDDDVLAVARELGSASLSEQPGGLNAALEQGRAWARDLGAEALLVVPGDVPLARASDFGALLAALSQLQGPALALTPSADGGTNALLLRPPELIPFRFGHDSAAQHQQEAERRGVAVALVPRPRLAFDVDSPADYQRYLALEREALAAAERPRRR
ncbi:MAG TPA: 2-phospho-L-lactate guanylyltransferase [Chloroflexota bacterium]|nr:2-phospho-L-lactate guanylyltransferase [Chloroflexota bacterium]